MEKLSDILTFTHKVVDGGLDLKSRAPRAYSVSNSPKQNVKYPFPLPVHTYTPTADLNVRKSWIKNQNEKKANAKQNKISNGNASPFTWSKSHKCRTHGHLKASL